MFEQMALNHLWQSTLFAVVAWLLTLALKKNRAQVRHWVWLVASAKFLVPLALLVSLGSRISWRTKAATPAIPIVMEQAAEPFTPRAPSVPQEMPTRVDPTPTLLWLIWGIGFVSIATRWGREWTRIHANVRSAKAMDLGLTIPVKSSSAVIEPGVFGILQPVLVLPDGIDEKLTPAQLEAILAHELCHVRRRDNLATAVHMLVEAMFWFHPLVWWIGARLIEERERSCDEEVLRTSRDPQTYAEGILRVCEFYLSSPLECVAGVSGANLKKRIEEIMTNRIAANLSVGRTALLASAGVLAVAAPIAAGLMSAPRIYGQSNNTASEKTFDVVSIRPSRFDSTGAILIGAQSTPGSITLAGIKPKDLLARAYSLKPYQILGPNWLDEEYYDIAAKTAQRVTPAEERSMLQSMLASRFELTAHLETKELPCYDLVVQKGGLKIQPAQPDDVGSRYYPNASGVRAKAIPMARLAELLTAKTDRPVLDKTGVAGVFDFDLKWASDTDADPGPSLFTAVQEQLALKLQPSKAPIQALVVDHIARPSQN